MKLVTVATHSDGYFPWLIQSCKRYNADLTVLGWGQKWQGFSWRFTLMIDFLKSLPPNEIVCFIDAYDVILLKPLKEIEKRFIKIHNETKCKMVVAQQLHSTQIVKWGDNITFGTCQERNVNAGTYIGYAKDLIQTLSDIYNLYPQYSSDDQKSLAEYCNKFPQNIYIDKTNNIFYTFIDLISATRKKLLKSISKHDSCILHAPGTTNITDELKQLNYTFTQEQEKLLNNYHKKTWRDKILYYLYLFRYVVVLSIVLLIIISISIYYSLSYIKRSFI